ncbi:hypothetical protein PIROE2DRAFT_5996 [Piromyces sp. E2]|nr:hypothetical protein PIROE2DRAFT_5996 [Piromyces sp. E2]|eukprot:OUM66685.1 hypothetical protein PIROE2DRAFT_5996 [Piromyces sp. E2]
MFLIINNYIALIYLTGILPLKSCELNRDFKGHFIEFSMASPKWMAKYMGFTDSEVKMLCDLYEKKLNTTIEDKTQNLMNKKQKLNDGSINKMDKNGKTEEESSHKNNGNRKETKEELSHKNNGNRKETEEELSHKNKGNGKEEVKSFYEIIKDFYNGYTLIDVFYNVKYKVYSPYSVINAINKGTINNYQMENKEMLYEIIQKNFYNLKYVILLLMEHEKVDIDSVKFQNDEISFVERKANLLLLVHLGYLGYDLLENNIFIPIKEIREIFELYIKSKNWENLNIPSDIYNPGEDRYSKFSKNRYFIDKTKLILQLNDTLDFDDIKNICVTRPRRFGKTVTVDMLTAYYSFSESKITVFEDKKITEDKDWDKYLGKFNVIKLDMSVINEVKKYDKNFEGDEEEDVVEITKKIYERTHREIVLIIDEWDLIFRDKRYDIQSAIEYLNFLTLLIKCNQYVALTYMTGILPIKNHGLQSSVRGVFNEFTMISNRLVAEYVGFTEDDVEELCKKHLSEQILINSYENKILLHENAYKNKIPLQENVYKDKEKIIAINFEMIKDWYKGYRLKNNNDGKAYDIYTPFSVIETIKNKKIENHWIKTESNSILIDYINKDLEGLKKDIILLMNKGKLKVNLNAYRSDVRNKEYESKDAILTALIHLGYLAYDSKSDYVYIPNKEIYTEFQDPQVKILNIITCKIEKYIETNNE